MIKELAERRKGKLSPTMRKLLEKRQAQIQALQNKGFKGNSSWNFSLDGRGLGIGINKDGKQFNLQIALPNSNNGQYTGELPVETTNGTEEFDQPTTNNSGGQFIEEEGSEGGEITQGNGEEELPMTQTEEGGTPAEQPTTGENMDSPESDTTLSAGEMAFEKAAASFKSGDFESSMDHIKKAIAESPDDVNILQFESLVQFAMQDYKPAAAAAKKAVVREAGWDWDTLKTLYSSTKIYTTHYRALETHCEQHPTDADARFLLAYHYLMCGHQDAAKTELAAAAKHAPQDAVITALYQAVSGSEE